MSTFIEDSPRPFQAGWMTAAHQNGDAQAVVLTPWASPYAHRGGSGNKPGIGRRVQEFRDAGLDVWFDPTSHALQMAGVGDFRYYNDFDLWGGPRGDLTEEGSRQEHVRRVFRTQDELATPHLGPTVLLQNGLSNLSTLALDVGRAATNADPSCWLSIAGTATFWADGRDLDAHVGAMASLQPSGWFVSFVQPSNSLPPQLTADAVEGFSRTVRALSEYAPVHVSHGDFAGLPAVAAGATSVGTGWDKRQRVVAYVDYAAREPAGGIASWYKRPTLLVLLSTLSERDGAILEAQNPQLAAELGGLPTPGASESFQHHIHQLHSATTRLTEIQTPEDRYRELDLMYDAARAGWARVHQATGISDQSSDWIDPLQQGLRAFGASEGWQI